MSATTSRLEKEKIIKELSKDKNSATHLEVIDYALNPYKRFGVSVSKFADLGEWANEEKKYLKLWPAVKANLDRMASGDLTGNAARSCIETMCKKPVMRPLIERILAKDLRVGATSKTFNKIIPGVLPDFKVCTARPDQKHLVYPSWAERKLDGVRAVCVINANGDVSFFSRYGKPYSNFPNITNAVKALGLNSVMLDGEIAGRTFDDVMNVAHRKRGLDDRYLKFVIFDCLDLEEFLAHTCSKELHERRKELCELVLMNGVPRSEFIEIIDGQMVEDREEMMELYGKVVDEGYEGLMVKDPNSKYEYKRSKAWIKVKPEISFDCPISGYYEGTKRLAGTLGGIVVTHESVSTEVGTGFSDELRRRIWDNREKYLGRIVEVVGQELTKDGCIRFPRFKRFREDKD